jgi:hypothetical protein
MTGVDNDNPLPPTEYTVFITPEMYVSGVSTEFSMRVPGPSGRPMTYANALKRTADQTGSSPQEDVSGTQSAEPEDEESGELDQEDWKPPPGPVKGFDAERVLENLDPQVREVWADRAHEAVFVHYLGGGYTPHVAQNVHVIANDLKSECSPYGLESWPVLTVD